MDVTGEAFAKNKLQLDSICSKMKKLLMKKQSFKKQQPNCVFPRLYVSNYSFAMNQNFIESQKITLIISCVKINEKDRIQNVEYQFLQVKDKVDEPIQEYFEKVFEKLENHFQKNQQECAMINCFSGISRSTTLAISYIMKKTNTDFQKTLQMVKKSRPQTNPNSGFIEKLKKLSEEIERFESLQNEQKRQNDELPEMMEKKDSPQPQIMEEKSSTNQENSEEDRQAKIKELTNSSEESGKIKQLTISSEQSAKVQEKEEERKSEESSTAKIEEKQQKVEQKEEKQEIKQQKIKQEVKQEVKQELRQNQERQELKEEKQKDQAETEKPEQQVKIEKKKRNKKQKRKKREFDA